MDVLYSAAERLALVLYLQVHNSKNYFSFHFVGTSEPTLSRYYDGLDEPVLSTITVAGKGINQHLILKPT